MVNETYFSKIFRKQHYPLVKKQDWDCWKWQYRNRLTDTGELAERFSLKLNGLLPEEQLGSRLPLSITPYYASVILGDDKQQGLIKTILPSNLELHTVGGETAEPLQESNYSPVAGLVHKYPGRVLLLAVMRCAVHCRYCTRAAGILNSREGSDKKNWEPALEYIRLNQGISEVIISGGDPLTLSDKALDDLLGSIRSIPQVKVIRLSTKVPVVLPQRITKGLLRIFKKWGPLFINLHVIHPAELSPVVKLAVTNMRGAGVVLGAQTVLLKGVNDSLENLKTLLEGLLAFGIRPYALYQCDLALGSSHFRTKIEVGLNLMDQLRKQISGLAIPHFVVDPPGGKALLFSTSSIPVKSQQGWTLNNWKGEKTFYQEN